AGGEHGQATAGAGAAEDHAALGFAEDAGGFLGQGGEGVVSFGIIEAGVSAVTGENLGIGRAEESDDLQGGGDVYAGGEFVGGFGYGAFGCDGHGMGPFGLYRKFGSLVDSFQACGNSRGVGGD